MSRSPPHRTALDGPNRPGASALSALLGSERGSGRGLIDGPVGPELAAGPDRTPTRGDPRGPSRRTGGSRHLRRRSRWSPRWWSIPVDSAQSAEPARSLGLMLALFSLPASRLLGAGLTSAALGTPPTAASAGLAMGVGVPVAAVTSAMIGAFILVGLARRSGRPHRWGGGGRGAAADRGDRRGPDLTADRDRVGRLGAARAAPRPARDGDALCRSRGPKPVVAQARTRTSSPRRMTPGRSTSPNMPNIRSLPLT